MMSSTSKPLYKAIIALAACQRSHVGDAELSIALLESAKESLGSDIYSRQEAAIASKHLLYIAQLLPLPIHQWRSAQIDAILKFDEMDLFVNFSDLRGSAVWLMLRFG